MLYGTPHNFGEGKKKERMSKKFYFLGEYWRMFYANDEAEVYRSADKHKWLDIFREGDETLIHLIKDDNDTEIITNDKGEWLYVREGTEKLTFLSKDGLSLSSDEENHLERILSAASKLEMELKEILRNSKNQRLGKNFFKNLGSFVSNLWNYLFNRRYSVNLQGLSRFR